jgi:uncharacterized membrane protein HdeD (DUF308 family)
MFDIRGPRWWAVALRGLAAVFFGVAMFVWPNMSLAVLIALFGAYALVDGIFAIAAAVRAAESQMRWWPLLLVGIAGIGAGVVTFLRPGLTAEALLYVIAFWAIAVGVFEIVAAIDLRRLISDEWLLGLSGALSIVFGILLLANPRAGILSILWIIGIYAIAGGITTILLGFRLRGVQEQTNRNRPALT